MPRVTGRGAWARPASRGRRHNWERRPRRSVGDADVLDGDADVLDDPAWEETAHPLSPPSFAEERLTQAAQWHAIYIMRARMLWSNNYELLLEAERGQCPELRVRIEEVFGTAVSGYRRRLRDPRLIAA